MLGLTGGYSPACLKVYALFGVKAAFFHSSAMREQKWAAKFKGNGYGCSSGEKEYRNYLKKRRRAVAKRDLLKWRTCEITIRNFDELFWSGGCSNFSRQQNQQCGGGRRHQQQRKVEEHNQEDVGHKKQKRRNQSQSNQEASKKEAQKDPFDDLWHKLNSSYSQWWGFSGFFNESFEEFRFPGERSSFSGSYSSSSNKKNTRVERTVGSPSDRQALGLSPTGSLTMEELKKAFRSSALKWHPDRHAGDAKAVAEAKFKDCGAAYKALLNVLAKA